MKLPDPQVCFATPANLDDVPLYDARVHVGFIFRNHKNSFTFQYADGTRRSMNKSKWVMHGSLIGARATLRKLLVALHAKAETHVQHIEYLMEGDML